MPMLETVLSYAYLSGAAVVVVLFRQTCTDMIVWYESGKLICRSTGWIFSVFQGICTDLHPHIFRLHLHFCLFLINTKCA